MSQCRALPLQHVGTLTEKVAWRKTTGRKRSLTSWPKYFGEKECKNRQEK
jgi:hypothetical protein